MVLLFYYLPRVLLITSSRYWLPAMIRCFPIELSMALIHPTLGNLFEKNSRFGYLVHKVKRICVQISDIESTSENDT